MNHHAYFIARNVVYVSNANNILKRLTDQEMVLFKTGSQPISIIIPSISHWHPYKTRPVNDDADRVAVFRQCSLSHPEVCSDKSSVHALVRSDGEHEYKHIL